MLVLVLDNAGEIYNRYYNVKLVEVKGRNFRIVHDSDVVEYKISDYRFQIVLI